MKLKGLIKTNGSYSYQRQVPKHLKDHPYFRGKVHYKKALGKKLADDEAIYQAWKSQHEAYEALIRNLEKANLQLLTARERTAEAEKLLNAYGLSPSELIPDPLLSTGDNAKKIQAAHYKLDASGLMDDATIYYEKLKLGQVDEHADLPAEVEVANDVWRLLNLPHNQHKSKNLLLSDCLAIYLEAKKLDPSDRQIKKTVHRWNAFFSFAGDCLLELDEIHARLDDYVQHRENTRALSIEETGKPTPSSSTIQKEIDMVVAIINVVTKKNRLSLPITKPAIVKTESFQREVLTHDEIIRIIERSQQQQAAGYKPWKELAILLLAQTSCINSELLRMPKTGLILDAEVPAIRIAGITKTKNRPRTIPLVYAIERIRELANNDSSDLLLGNIANRTESNISAQLNTLIRSVNPKATAYSFRHTFKHNAALQNIDLQNVAYLGGWSGSKFGLNDIMLNYGKAGMETPQMLLRLQSDMKLINSHLLQLETGNTNIVNFHNLKLAKKP
jgi:integrase